MITLSEIMKKYLGDPPMYKGYPVDLSNLDMMVTGFTMDTPSKKKDASVARCAPNPE